MRWSRRDWLLATASMAIGCGRRPIETGCAALAGKTIRWIVPFSDGGTHEVLSRLVEPFLERSLRTEVVIVTEPGNGGIVGAAKVRDAVPDGRTLGILNSAGLFVAAVAGQTGSPNPVTDFSVLGRLGRSRPVLAVAASSPIESVDDLIVIQQKRPLIVGISGMASNSLLVFSTLERLLGLRLDYISGFSGSRDTALAVLRGELDLLGSNFDSMQQQIAQGDLRVLLQLTERLEAEDEFLRNVPLLGGPEGWAARRAVQLGRDPQQATADASAFSEMAGAGIIAAAPNGIPADLLSCLRASLFEAASAAEFQQAARTAFRTPDVATGEEAARELSNAGRHVARFAPIVRAAFAKARK